LGIAGHAFLVHRHLQSNAPPASSGSQNHG
jgi:hypothetical protein